MKYFIIFLSFIFMFNLANSQSQAKPKVSHSIKLTEPDKDTEALKKKVKAPNPADYKTEEAYLKAKAKWVKNNQESYQKIVGLKEENVSQPE